MSLLEHMSGGEVFRKVHVSEIRPNPINFYSQINEDENILVNDMASLLLEDGQDANGIVYVDTSIDDGKKYTLIAGERRWKAILLNFMSGKSDGMYEVKIIAKPENKITETLRIIRNNAQRNKSKAIRQAEVDALVSVWDSLVASNQKPEGKKREWIAKNIGMSPRRVQEYLTGDVNLDDNVQLLTESNTEREELSSTDKEHLKNLAKEASEKLGRKVKVSNKFAITIQAEDLFDVENLLNELTGNYE